MSTKEILKELPKLSLSDRRKIIRLLLELEEDREALDFATQAAGLAFREMDRREEEDAKRAAR